MSIVSLLVFAGFYYRVGDLEYDRGFLVGGLSALLWIGSEYVLGWGWLASIGVQAGLYVVLTAINMRDGTTRASRSRT